jgi:4-diphosphocytidyl-2C-methyl-D-erythritol kinase
MVLEAFAKINWSLDIVGVREDGYHLMDMLMQPVSVSDEITLVPSRDMEITVSGRFRCRADETNLAFRAASALKSKTGYGGGVRIHVNKSIPIGAGMGGGSADAAAVLWGLNRMWKTGLSEAELESLGLSLGADIPFALRGGLARTGGIGEKLESHECPKNYWIIIVQPCRGLSTAEVFSRWHANEASRRPSTDVALRALKSGDLPTLCSHIGNVLQPVSEQLRPAIAQCCRELTEAGALVAEMTGSGSAVFGVCLSPAIAENIYRKLSSRYKTVFLCHTQQDSIRILRDE